MLLKFKGLKWIARLKRINAKGENAEYMAIYKFDSRQDFKAYDTSPELAAALKEARESWRETSWKVVQRVQYEF